MGRSGEGSPSRSGVIPDPFYDGTGFPILLVRVREQVRERACAIDHEGGQDVGYGRGVAVEERYSLEERTYPAWPTATGSRAKTD
jgi:hypothetical protein